MISLEVIGVLGILCCFLLYAMVRAYFLKHKISVREKIRESRLVLAVTNLIAALSRSLAHSSPRRQDRGPEKLNIDEGCPSGSPHRPGDLDIRPSG